MPVSSSQNHCCQCLCLQSETLPPSLLEGGAPTPAGRSSLCRQYFFLLGSGLHITLCVPYKSGFSISPSPVEVLQSNPADFKSQISWGFPGHLPNLQAGKPDVGLRTFTVGELLWHY